MATITRQNVVDAFAGLGIDVSNVSRIIMDLDSIELTSPYDEGGHLNFNFKTLKHEYRTTRIPLAKASQDQR